MQKDPEMMASWTRPSSTKRTWEEASGGWQEHKKWVKEDWSRGGDGWNRWRWEQQDEWSEVGEDEQEKTEPLQEHGEAVLDDTKPCQAQGEEKQSEGSEPCLQKPEQLQQKKNEWWEWEKPRKEWEWEKPRTPTSTPHLQQQDWQKPKSGWMNRLTTLLAALKRGDEVRVKYLTKKFSEHWAVESLVTRHIECINRWGWDPAYDF